MAAHSLRIIATL